MKRKCEQIPQQVNDDSKRRKSPSTSTTAQASDLCNPESKKIYDALKEVKFNSDDSGNSLEWAGIDQINSYVNQAISDNKNDLAYYVGPNNFGFDDEESIKDIAKHVCRKADGSSNYFYGLQESLDKPFIVVSNTDTALAHNPTDVNKQGGFHWISWVLLPKKYRSLSGKEINNDKYKVLFFDSLGQRSFPKGLKTFLTEGGEITETTDTGEKKIRLLPFCTKEEIDFECSKGLTGQQMNGSDCGWWAVYYVLMTVYTGGVEFLEPLKGERLSAKPLRSMMNLQEGYQSLTDNRQPVDPIDSGDNSSLDYNDEMMPEEELISFVRGATKSREARLEEIKKLFEKEPRLNVNFQEGINNDTPLHIAVRRGEQEIIVFLLEKGAKINDIKNKRNRTPLETAKRRSKANGREIVNILEEHLKSLSGSSGQQASVEQPPQRKKAKIGSELEDSMPKFSAGQGSSISSYDSQKSIPSLFQEQGSINDRDNMEVDSEKQTRKRPATDAQSENSNLRGPKISKPSWRLNPTHATGGLKRSLHGNTYQLNLLILFAWRYKGNVAFRLGTEVADAGKFDDLVLRYQNDQGETQYRFLQAKHAQHLTEKSNLQYEEFFILDDKKDFSLRKYFLSYLGNIGKFQDGSIEDLTICTNKDFEQSVIDNYLEGIPAQDTALSLGGKRYKFNQAKIVEVIQKLSEVLNKDTRSAVSNKHKDETILKFLENLRFAVGQPSGPELGNMIREEIGGEFNLMNDITYNDFHKFMSDWMEYRKKEKEGPEIAYFLTHDDLKQFVNEAKIKIAELVLIGPTSLRRLEIKEHGITFKSEGATIKKLKGFLTSDNEKQIFNLVAQKTLLGAIKVDNVLDGISLYKEKKDSHIFVQQNTLYLLKEELIKAFESETDNLLVIECNPISEDRQGLYDKLSRIVQNNSNKKVILITQEGNDLANKFEQGFSQSDKYEEGHDDKNGFKNLNAQSKQKLSDKKVIFQGEKKKLGELVDNESLKKIIGPDELIELNTSDEIKIGKAYEFSYVPNSELDREWKSNKVSAEVLSETDNKDNFVLEVVGGKKKMYGSLQAKLRQTHSNKKIFVCSSRSAEIKFQKHVNEDEAQGVYWLRCKFSELEGGKNAVLELIKSRGSLDALRKHVVVGEESRDFQINHLDRVFILHGESGIGKTVLLNELCYECSQSLWVMDINLFSCPRGIWSNKNFGRNDNANINSFIEVLKELGKLNNELEKSLFRFALEGKGVKLGIFFDSFEMIGKSDQEAVLSLLKTIKDHTKVEKLVVATRSYDKHKIEDVLSEFAHELPKLKDPAQKKILEYFLKGKDRSNVERLVNIYKKVDISFPISLALLSNSSEGELSNSEDNLDLAGLIKKYVEALLDRSARTGGTEFQVSKKLRESISSLAILQVFKSVPVQKDKSFIEFAKVHVGIGGIFDTTRDTSSPVLLPIVAESLVKTHPAIQRIIKQRKKEGFNINNIDQADNIIKENYYTDIAKPIRGYVDRQSIKDTRNPIFEYILDAREEKLSLSNFKNKLTELKNRNERQYYGFLREKGVLSLAADYYNTGLVKILIGEILSEGLEKFDKDYGVLDRVKEKKKESFKKKLYGKYGDIKKFNVNFFYSDQDYLLYLSNRIKHTQEISKANNKFFHDLLYFARLGNIYAVDVVFSTNLWIYYYSDGGVRRISLTPKDLSNRKSDCLIRRDIDLINNVVKEIKQKYGLLSSSVEKQLYYLSVALIRTKSGQEEVKNDKGGKILYNTIYHRYVIVRNELLSYYGREGVLNELGTDGKAFAHRLIECPYSVGKIRKYIRSIKKHINIDINVPDRSGRTIISIAVTNKKFDYFIAILEEFPDQMKQFLDFSRKRILRLTQEKKSEEVSIFYIFVAREIPVLYQLRKDYKEALKWFQILEKLQGQIFGPGSPEALSTAQEIVILLKLQREYKKALEKLKKMLIVRRKSLNIDENDGFSDPNLLFIEHEMAMINLAEGQYYTALEKFEEVLNGRMTSLEDTMLEKEQLKELLYHLKLLKKSRDNQTSSTASKLLDLVQETLQYKRCVLRKKRQVSIPCVDSNSEESQTEREKKLIEELSNEEIEGRIAGEDSITQFENTDQDLIDPGVRDIVRKLKVSRGEVSQRPVVKGSVVVEKIEKVKKCSKKCV